MSEQKNPSFDLKHPPTPYLVEAAHRELDQHPIWAALHHAVEGRTLEPGAAVAAILVFAIDDLPDGAAEARGVSTRQVLDALAATAFAAREQMEDTLLLRDLDKAFQRALDDADTLDDAAPLDAADTQEEDTGGATHLSLTAAERRYLADLINAAPVHAEEKLYGEDMHNLWFRLARPVVDHTNQYRNPFKAIELLPGVLG